MKRFLKLFHPNAVAAAFPAAPSHATQPGQTASPHGSTRGEHNNLNISGKKG